MKYGIALLLSLACFYGSAQTSKIQEATEKARQQLMVTNSTIRRLNATTDSIINSSLEKQRKQDAEEMGRRSSAMMLQWQREHQEKQRKKMYLYLGMGILFAGVLAAGLLRRSKKKV